MTTARVETLQFHYETEAWRRLSNCVTLCILSPSLSLQIYKRCPRLYENSLQELLLIHQTVKLLSSQHCTQTGVSMAYIVEIPFLPPTRTELAPAHSPDKPGVSYLVHSKYSGTCFVHGVTMPSGYAGSQRNVYFATANNEIVAS
jgi:hypothetical protein